MSDPGKKDNAGSLAHMIYLCPGLHGKESKQDIRRQTFRQFFKENGRLIIPLCQRRYCWPDKTVWHWFEDVVRGKRDHLGIHNSGNLIVKKSTHKEGMIIIDGQQRVTTTMILLAALKDEVIKIGIEHKEKMNSLSRNMLAKCVRDLRSTIFMEDIDVTDEEIDKSQFEEGEDLSHCRLLPSFCDRKPFFELMCSPNLKKSENEEVSYQFRAKEIFRSRIAQEIAEKRLTSVDAQVEWLSEVVYQALDLMGITFVEILNDINMAQVFLWLQERSLFGEAALLFNPTPGMFFTAVDMVRNLFLSPTMNQSIEEQELFYRKNWLDPVESNFSGHDHLNRFNQTLSDFVKMKTKDIVHTSAAESTYLALMNSSKSISPKGKKYIETYAKFSSLIEKEGNDFMEKLQRDSAISTETMEPSEEVMQKVSVSISADFAQFIARKKLEEVKKSEIW